MRMREATCCFVSGSIGQVLVVLVRGRRQGGRQLPAGPVDHGELLLPRVLQLLEQDLDADAPDHQHRHEDDGDDERLGADGGAVLAAGDDPDLAHGDFLTRGPVRAVRVPGPGTRSARRCRAATAGTARSAAPGRGASARPAPPAGRPRGRSRSSWSRPKSVTRATPGSPSSGPPSPSRRTRRVSSPYWSWIASRVPSRTLRPL